MVKTIPLSGGSEATVDDEDYLELSKYKWHRSSSKSQVYAVSQTNNRKLLMHRIIMNAPKNTQVDHINHDGLDNRRENLRICNNSQNMANSRKRNNASSKYKGVSWDDSRKQWRASIPIFLGRFDSEIEAAKAYDKKAKELYGEFALLNF